MKFTDKHRDLIRGFLEQYGRGDWNVWFDYEYRTLAAAVDSASDFLPERAIKKMEKELKDLR